MRRRHLTAVPGRLRCEADIESARASEGAPRAESRRAWTRPARLAPGGDHTEHTLPVHVLKYHGLQKVQERVWQLFSRIPCPTPERAVGGMPRTQPPPLGANKVAAGGRAGMELRRSSSAELARTLSERERHARAAALASIVQSDQESASLDAQQAIVDAALQQLQGPVEPEPETKLQSEREPEPEHRASEAEGTYSRYLNVALVGDWSAGKSAATAGLLLATGAVGTRRLHYLQEYWAQHPWAAAPRGAAAGAQPMPLGAVVDRTRKERESGSTIDGNIAGLRLPDGRVCTLFDTPGRPEFAKKSVQMLSQADAAVLVVDATLFAHPRAHQPEPAAASAALQRWQRRVASLAAAFHTFSVKQLVVCVTKMDLVGYRQEVYEEACKQTVALLHSVSKKLSVTSLPLVHPPLNR